MENLKKLLDLKKSLLEKKKQLLKKEKDVSMTEKQSLNNQKKNRLKELFYTEKKLLETKKNILEKEKNIINEERQNILLNKELLKKQIIDSKLLEKSKKSYTTLDNNLSGGINTNEGIIQTIKNFFNSNYYIFIKNYLYFIILFSIIFYILLYISDTSRNNVIIGETKIFFYLAIIFLFIVINDIMSSPQEDLNKFVLLILFSLIIIYICGYFINKYYSNEGFNERIKKIFIIIIFVFIVFSIIIYFQYQKKKPNIAYNLYQNFNNGFNKNFKFLIFFIFYVIIYKLVDYYTNWNSELTNILSPTILGGFLIFFIFCILIFLSLKMKIINNKQILNSLLALFGISILLGLLYLYIFMKSLNTICEEGQEYSQENDWKIEILRNLIIISIIIILWLDDSRNWHQIGSLLFIFATIIMFISMFYYSSIYPSIGLLSFWLFIEWIIIIYRRKENSKNSIHFSFMKT
jgi:hypothetical protein